MRRYARWTTSCAGINAIAPSGGMHSPFYEANFGPYPHRVL